jgi:hypothetical protein
MSPVLRMSGAAPGFIHVWGLPVRVQARAQMVEEEG